MYIIYYILYYIWIHNITGSCACSGSTSFWSEPSSRRWRTWWPEATAPRWWGPRPKRWMNKYMRKEYVFFTIPLHLIPRLHITAKGVIVCAYMYVPTTNNLPLVRSFSDDLGDSLIQFFLNWLKMYVQYDNLLAMGSNKGRHKKKW